MITSAKRVSELVDLSYKETFLVLHKDKVVQFYSIMHPFLQICMVATWSFVYIFKELCN